jgi:tubulin alpha
MAVPAVDFAKVNFTFYMIANTSSIEQIISRLSHKYHILYTRRTFVHWYVGEGINEG